MSSPQSSEEKTALASETAGAPGNVTAVIPDHQLIRTIGRGSYGEVWLARNVMGTFRAVKIVYRDAFKDEKPYEREFSGIQKFEPLSRSHEGLVDILQIGRNDAAGYFYYVMELADDARVAIGSGIAPAKAVEVNAGSGAIPAPALPASAAFDPAQYEPRTLRTEIVRHGRLAFRDYLELGLSMSSALAHLHEHGLIHRDVKPSNIIYVNGIAKLADIGLVAGLDEARSFVGTEGYIPPEGPGTAQADIFSLGKVLYEAATGKDRQEFPELPTGLSGTGSDAELIELNEIILKACESDVDHRYQSAREVQADLVLLQSGRSVKHLRAIERHLAFARKVGLGLGLAIVTALLLFLIQWQQTHLLKQTAETQALAASDSRRKAETNRRLAQESQTRLVRQYVDKGAQLLQRNDPQAALLWFAEAFAIDTQPERESIHRRRIASVWHACLPLQLQWLEGTGKTRVGFSPQDKFVFAVVDSGEPHGSTGQPRIWEIETGALRTNLLASSDTNITAGLYNKGLWLLFSRLWIQGIPQDGDVLVEALSGRPLTGQIEPTEPLSRFEIFETTEGKKLFIVFYQDDSFEIWDVTDRQLLFPQPTERVQAMEVRLSADGQRIAAAQLQQIQIWNRSGTVIAKLPMPQPLSMDFSASGEWVAARCVDDQVRVFSVTAGKPIDQRPGKHFVRFSPDEQELIYGTSDASAEIMRLDSPGSDAVRVRLAGNLEHAAFSADGLRLLTSDTSGCIRLWARYRADRRLFEIKHNNAVDNALYSADGKFIFAESGDSNIVWEAQSGKRVQAGPHAPASAFHGLNNPDGNARIEGLDEIAIRLVRVASGQPLTMPIFHRGPIRDATFSADGRLVATASEDRTAQVWDAGTGEPVTGSLPHPAKVLRVCFHPDGTSLVTSCADGIVRVWTLAGDDRPAADLVKLGRLAAGHEIDETGSMLPLDGESMQALWEELAQKYPRDFSFDPPKLLAWHRSEAEAWEQNGQWAMAHSHVNRLMAMQPHDLNLRKRRGMARARLMDWKGATEDFSAALRSSNDDQSLLSHLGICQLASGDLEGYEVTCRSLWANMTNRSDPEAVNLLRLSLIGHSRAEVLAQAKSVTDKLAGGNIPNPSDTLLLALVKYRSGAFKECAALLESSRFESAPIEKELAPLLQIMALSQTGQIHQALAIWDECEWTRFRSFGMRLDWHQEIERELLRAEAHRVLTEFTRLNQ